MRQDAMIMPPAVIYPPNRPLERNLMPSKSAVLYDFLLFLDANDKGEFVLGSANINGTYWEGVLCHYKNAEDLLSKNHCGYYISTTSVSDAKFITETHVILAEDTGHLKLLKVNDVGDPNIKCQDVVGANSMIEQLSVWKGSSKLLSCADTTIGLWDVSVQAGITPIAEYSDYHLQRILSVDANKEQPHYFASASADRKVCLWDNRQQMPATVLYENEFTDMTSVVWDPFHENYLSAGSRAGYVYRLDLRTPKDFVSHIHCFDNDIHRMAHHGPDGKLAVCGDTNRLIIIAETSNKIDFEVVHSNDNAPNFIRGLTWHDEFLYTCGFDKSIVKHRI